MTDLSFGGIIGYGAMALFIAIPIARTLTGSPLSMQELLIAYGLAVGFALYATHELEKYDNIKKASKILEEKYNEFRSNDFKDRTLKEKCPKCNSELKEISKANPEKKIFGHYSGLIYCTVCDFEESKEEFDLRFI